jgi:hypothetical protein
MDGLDYWRVCDELSVVQAALLMLEIDPADETGSYCEQQDVHNRPTGYEALKMGISNALRRGLIEGKLIPIFEYDMNNNQGRPFDESVDVKESRVDVASLKNWLLSRGIKSGFFFFNQTDAPDYLDRKNPRFAPKLAAAVQAWQAVTDPGHKSPKQALDKWLRENAAALGLANEDGNPIEQAIEDCSKVANWNTSGGAPKTPVA